MGRFPKIARFSPNTGFTLVELMVAMAIGMVLCYTTFAALRVASQATTTVNRLSVENQLMRSGVLAGLEDLDTWNSYDDPNTVSNQPLRKMLDGSPAYPNGMPFAPLTISNNPTDANYWDVDYDQSDPKTWFRGMGFTGWWTYGQFGTDYWMHSRLGHSDAERRWYPDMLTSLCWNLGYYGMFDYAPANAGYFHYRADTWYSDEWVVMGPTANRRLINSNNWRWQVRDIGGETAGSCYVVTTNASYLENGNRFANRRFFMNYIDRSKSGGLPADIDDWMTVGMYKNCRQPLPLFAPAPGNQYQKPQNWPTLEVKVAHFLISGRFWNNIDVNLVNPSTGQSMRVYTSAVSTTLRGARQQRGLDTYQVPPP